MWEIIEVKHMYPPLPSYHKVGHDAIFGEPTIFSSILCFTTCLMMFAFDMFGCILCSACTPFFKHNVMYESIFAKLVLHHTSTTSRVYTLWTQCMYSLNDIFLSYPLLPCENEYGKSSSFFEIWQLSTCNHVYSPWMVSCLQSTW